MPTLTLHEIYLAQQRIAPFIDRTSLQRSSMLSAQLGFDVWLKMENRQRTGSFKPRGALNKIMSLSEAERAHGIVAASAGNHALGVAYAVQCLGLTQADVFVQANAAPAKLAKLKQYNVQLHLIGHRFDEAHAAAFEFSTKTGATYISAYDDLQVIAGQGTIGLEIMQELPDADTLVVPVGGGGLITGIATVARALNPTIRIIGVNPEASPSAYLSKRDGFPYEEYDNAPTLAHGLAGGFGRVPFMAGMMLIDEIVLVSEDEMKRGIAALIDSDQVLLEASGVAGIAAILAGKVEGARKCVAVLTGGNIDSDTLREVLGVNELRTNQRMGGYESTTNRGMGVNELTTNQRMGGNESATNRGMGVNELTTNQRIEATSESPTQKREARSGRATVTAQAGRSKNKPGLVKTPNDDFTYRLIGLAMEVHNELGPGHRESAYHDALAAKMAQTELEFLDEPEILVELEDGTTVQKYIPDFIVQDNIIVELKAQTWPMTKDDMAQVFDYFAGTGCEEALFLNFGRPRLDYHRLLPPQHIDPRRKRKPKS